MFPNEVQTRKQLIDHQISKAGWNLFDRQQVGFEVPASGDDDDWTDGITDYSLYRENGEIIAVVEAKKQSRSPHTARQQDLVLEYGRRNAPRSCRFLFER
jgi:type I site-specific restriction endonuclease